MDFFLINKEFQTFTRAKNNSSNSIILFSILHIRSPICVTLDKQ